MPDYKYQGADAEGRPVQGSIQAVSRSRAEAQLQQQGIVVESLTGAPASGGDALSQREAEDLAGAVATLSGGGMALAPGLRAASLETQSPRLARALTEMALRLEGGASLDDVMLQQSTRMPEHIRMLVVAASRSGRLAEVLADLIDHHRDLRMVWRSVRAAMAYPLMVVVMSLALLVVVHFFVATPFIEVYESFEIELPPSTQSMKWWTTRGVYVAAAFTAIAMVVLLLVRLFGGAARWSRMLCTVPLVGSMFHLSASAEFTHLLSILLEHGMPLPEALRLTASGMQNANLAEASAAFAVSTQKGATLSQLLRSSQRAPASLTPLVAWGERAGDLPGALETACQMFKQRVKLRAALLRSILPPAMFLMVGALLMVLAVSLAAPAIHLITALMGTNVLM